MVFFAFGISDGIIYIAAQNTFWGKFKNSSIPYFLLVIG